MSRSRRRFPGGMCSKRCNVKAKRAKAKRERARAKVALAVGSDMVGHEFTPRQTYDVGIDGKFGWTHDPPTWLMRK